MFYHPELIVYLWLLPVTMFVVIPAGLSACRAVMCIAKESPVEETYIQEQEILAKA